MRNLVLIGMPGSGKTTVGEILASRLGLPLIDTDVLVAEADGRSIPEIFAQEGEEFFRDLESAAAEQAAAYPGAVIATGGGIVKREQNMQILMRTGQIFFLDRPPEDIAGENHSARPLMVGGRDKVFRLYVERIDLYRKYAQHRIAGVTAPEEAAQLIITIYEKAGKGT